MPGSQGRGWAGLSLPHLPPLTSCSLSTSQMPCPELKPQHPVPGLRTAASSFSSRWGRHAFPVESGKGDRCSSSPPDFPTFTSAIQQSFGVGSSLSGLPHCVCCVFSPHGLNSRYRVHLSKLKVSQNSLPARNCQLLSSAL